MKSFLSNKNKFRVTILIILISFCYIFVNNIYANTDLDENGLYCNSDLVMDYESGNVLFEKNGYNKVYPASTTKILTAILTIENLDLDKSIVASKEAIYSTPIGSSVIYLQVQEVMSVKDLLYGLLLESGNDAANVLAEAVSGNIPDFIKLMNQKLKEIGCQNTHFTNAHGFHDDEHYTTVYDMAILMRYAMQNNTFRQILETKEYTIESTNKSKERNCTNTNKMFDPDYPQMYYEYILGGKTGYTEEARGTFVGYGKKDDKMVIVCAFDGSQNINRQEGRFLDSIKLFEYAFNNFNKYKIADKNTYKFNIYDENYNEKYTLSIDSDKYALFNNDFFYSNYDIELNSNDLSNIELNSKVGTIKIKSTGNSLNCENTYDLLLIEKTNYFSINSLTKYFKIIVLIILIIILFILLKKINKHTKRRKNTYNKINYKKITKIK